MVQSHFMHCVENSSMNRFESVFHIRKCAVDNNRHSVIQIRPFHFYCQFCFLQCADIYHKKLFGETFFFEALNTLEDYFVRFLAVSPAAYFCCDGFFLILMMGKMKFDFLLPTATQVIKCLC